MQLTISEGIATLKMLRERHAELVALRNKNSEKETRFFGADASKQRDIVPVYDVEKLDALVTQVAKEIRKLDMALKMANASTPLHTYDWNEEVMGQVE